MFKKLLTATAITLSTFSFAHAADDLQISEATYDWAGRYIGVQIGVNFLEDDWQDPIPPFIGDTETNGISAGLLLGYNFQNSDWVYGIEGDFEFADVDGQDQGNGPAAFVTGVVELNWQASIRARVGKVVNNTLFYGTGGVAFGDFDFNYHLGVPLDGYEDTLTGWTVGGGFEQAMSNDVNFRLEYRYTDFGDSTSDITNCCAAPPFRQIHEVTTNTIRVGLSKQF